MKNIILMLGAIILIALMILPTASSYDIEYNPKEFVIDLVAGDKICRNVSITNNEDKKIALNLSTGPEYDGIIITYSTNIPIILTPQETIVVGMYINTSMLLMPGTYKFLTMIYSEKEVEPGPEPGSGKNKKSSSDQGYVPLQPDAKDQETEPSDYNEEEDEFIWPPYQEDVVEASLPWFAIPVSILIAMLIASMIVLAIYLKRRKKNENEK